WCLANSWCFAARDFGLPLGARCFRTGTRAYPSVVCKGLFKNNFRFWRERRLARCEARGASARAPGASPPVGCDRRATKQMAKRRPAPEGWGCLAVWRCCSLLTDRWRVCSSLAPSQTAKQPPAKSEFIFEQTLNLDCLNRPILSFARRADRAVRTPIPFPIPQGRGGE